MPEPTYQNAISKAWHLVWHHKALWILGLLSVIIGQFGLADFIGRVWLITNQHTVFSGSLWPQGWQLSSAAWQWPTIVGIVWSGALVLSLVIAALALAVISQGALIYYAALWFKNNGFFNLKKAWHHGVARFWQLLAVNILYRLGALIMLVLLSALFKVYFASANIIISILVAIALAGALFIYLLLAILYVYSAGYIVLDKGHVFKSIGKAWDLLNRHLIVSIEVGLILAVINFLLLAVLLFGLLFAFVPTAIMIIIASLLAAKGLAMAAIIIGFALWTIFIALCAGFYNAFTTSAWMFLFVKMHREGIASRIVGWIATALAK